MGCQMDIKPITESFAVSPQIEPKDVAEIAKLGFRAIMCNRPDGEAADQPLFAQVEEAAREAGLETVFLPVISGRLTDDDLIAFKNEIERLNGPVLAYCRTGTRCTVLWSLDQGARGVPTDQILAAAAKAGYDMSGLSPRIAELSGR